MCSARLPRNNAVRSTGGATADGASMVLDAGARLRSVTDVEQIVVSTKDGQRVLLRDVAAIVDGDAEPTAYVSYVSREDGSHPAVTIAVSKRKGTNATSVAAHVIAKTETMRGTIVPDDVRLSITRDYGETAAEKGNELLWHMLIAVLSVSALIWLALGRREAAVVLIAIPVTLALTLFTFYLYGYTLNRITLFALIFSIGILVDDAIVVVENIVRHARELQ